VTSKDLINKNKEIIGLVVILLLILAFAQFSGITGALTFKKETSILDSDLKIEKIERVSFLDKFIKPIFVRPQPKPINLEPVINIADGFKVEEMALVRPFDPAWFNALPCLSGPLGESCYTMPIEGTYDPDGNIKEMEIVRYFFDGTFEEMEFVNPVPEDLELTFDAPGLYFIIIDVIDNKGKSVRDYLYIDVCDPAAATCIQTRTWAGAFDVDMDALLSGNCGDGICQDSEKERGSCPEDCGSGTCCPNSDGSCKAKVWTTNGYCYENCISCEECVCPSGSHCDPSNPESAASITTNPGCVPGCVEKSDCSGSEYCDNGVCKPEAACPSFCDGEYVATCTPSGNDCDCTYALCSYGCINAQCNYGKWCNPTTLTCYNWLGQANDCFIPGECISPYEPNPTYCCGYGSDCEVGDNQCGSYSAGKCTFGCSEPIPQNCYEDASCQ